MALQTISQVLAPNNAPYINGVAARARWSAAVLVNLYQELVEKDGKGIDDNFVSPSEAEDSVQIFVHRVLPNNIQPREIGASKNGAAYSQNQHYSQTETVGIEILTLIDDPILIPRVTQDHIPVDLLSQHTKIFSGRLATILNGATFASKVIATYIAKSKGEEINETVISASDITNNKILNKYVYANAKLDEGDDAHGIDIFPRDTRICVVKTSFGPILKTDGVLKLGGANEAYAILKAAGVSNDTVRLENDGYIGTIDGVEVREISNQSLQHASLFLGFPAADLKNSNLYGYIASSYANARGVSTDKRTKVVDEVNGQGIRLLPYVKFGVVSWYQKGNSFLTAGEYDPFTGLKLLFSSVASELTFKLKAAGSRLFPVFAAAGISLTSNTAFTLAGTHAYDDFNQEKLKGGYYVVTDNAVKTVDEFIRACTKRNATTGALEIDSDTNENGTYNIVTGGSKSFTASLTSGQWVNVLAISTDGSCSLISKQYVAG